jgi:hypothetical protein
MSPDRWLAAADEMLRGAGAVGSTAVTGGWWPKACACLIRLALESGLDTYWRRVKPEVAQCRTGRTRLLMLRARYGPGSDVARRMSFAWATLSRAMHHHCYVAPLTAAELRSLHAEVRDLLAGLANRPAAELS